MSELILTSQNGQVVTTSRQVADNFGRLHKDVLESIRVISTQISTAEFSTLFFHSEYVASNGKKNPEYLMNRDGFTLLAMGFTGADAMQWKIKYIQAFNDMEKQLSSPQQLTRLQILEMAMESEKKVIELQATITEQQPKILLADSITASKTSISVNELSKLLKQNGIDIGQNRLFDWLREHGYLCKIGDTRNLPTQRSMDMKLFEIKKTAINHSNGIVIEKTSKVTGKGVAYFINRFLDKPAVV